MDQLYLNFSLQALSDMWFGAFSPCFLHPQCRAHRSTVKARIASPGPRGMLVSCVLPEQSLNCRSKQEPSCAGWTGWACCSSSQPAQPRAAVPGLVSRQGHRGQGRACRWLQRARHLHQLSEPLHIQTFSQRELPWPSHVILASRMVIAAFQQTNQFSGSHHC